MKILKKINKEEFKEFLFSIDLTDKNIYDELNSSNTNGIFQFDGNVASLITKKVVPKNFNEMIAINSLARPGTSSFVDDYIAGRNEGKQKYPKAVSNLLEDTYNICIYQEQIMSIFNIVGGFSLEETNDIRGLMKKLGKADRSEEDLKKWEKAVKKFVKGAIKNGLTEQEAEFVAQDLLAMSSYSFNKCFSGYSIIDRMNPQKSLSIEETFKIKNNREYAKTINKLSLHNKYNRKGYGKAYSLDENNMPIYNKIVDIRYESRRVVFRILLENNKSIKVTKNHKFPVLLNSKNIIEKNIQNGLRVGDILFSFEGKEFIPQKIVSINRIGEENVYDVEMENPYHTISVNGILAKNSHATAYSYIAVITLFLSFYFKNYYLASVLQNEIESGSNLMEKIQLIKNQKINILSPDINISKETVITVNQNILRLGFSNIKKISLIAAKHIVENQPYKNLFDFIFKINGRIVRIDAVKALVSVGAFDFETENRKKLLRVVELYWKNKKSIKVREKLETIWKKSYSVISDLEGINTSNVELKDWEIEYYGVNIFTSVFSNKILKILQKMKEKSIIYYSFEEVRSVPKKVPVYIQNIRNYTDKNGNEMVFLQIEDVSGRSESIPIFASFWKFLKNQLEEKEIYLLQLYKNGESLMFGANRWVNKEARIKRMIKPLILGE